MRKRRLLCEELCSRRLFAIDSLPWMGASSLRLSFVPDGTEVAGNTSDLQAAFVNTESADNWQQTIARAFGIWAQYANINVGVVADDGSPLGTPGLIRGDERFGEIRVAGVPMSEDTWAASIHHDSTAVGTWAGDLLFNTDIDWKIDPKDLLKIAVHEAGHVLGLPHSDEENSPMHIHGIPKSAIPTATDIALLQEIYGVRTPDFNEQVENNNVMERATRLKQPSSVVAVEDTPLVHFGEIQNANDVDYFFVRTGDFSGAGIRLRATSLGLSQLPLTITALDRDGNVLGVASGTAIDGDDLELNLVVSSSDNRIFLRVEAREGVSFPFGSYVVAAEADWYDELYPWQERLAEIQAVERWFASSSDTLVNFDLSTLFVTSSAELPQDDGLDDTSVDAPHVAADIATNGQLTYLLVANLHSATDVDNYRMRSPATWQNRGLHVQLMALQVSADLPTVRVLDSWGNIQPVETVIRGNGLLEYWLPSVTPDSDYLVEVSANPSSESFNYELAASYRESFPTLEPFLDVNLAANSTQRYDWYASRAQLISLSFDNASAELSPTAMVQAILRSEDGAIVGEWTASVHDFTTVTPVLLDPGRYILELSTNASQQVGLLVIGDTEIDPLGPKPKTGALPIYTCPGQTEIYCYPNQPPTKKPIAIVPPRQRLHNLDRPTDVNGDGHTTPVDVLLIVNALRKHGATEINQQFDARFQVDINDDGLLSPLDALLIVNQLNKLTRPEGESDGVQMPLAYRFIPFVELEKVTIEDEEDDRRHPYESTVI